MKLAKAALNCKRLVTRRRGPEVEETVAAYLANRLFNQATHERTRELPSGWEASFLVATGDENVLTALEPGHTPLPARRTWAVFRLREDGSGYLIANRKSWLYTAATFLAEDFENDEMPHEPTVLTPAFENLRPLFDYFLTQPWRVARKFDPERYVALYARLGYTHVEVNGLGTPYPLEPGVPGEVYPNFYQYCPALDQFVSSSLNRGVYPADYLATNLGYLKRNAALARKYGLEPGLLVFEPRSVPETLFERHPMLRGARVDHPFRSLKPRYNLTLAHPAVKAHYRELIQALLREVPELAYINIWSNDSGAGFEHTHSLYVGRNGGAYLIREWKTHEEIARTAANNIGDFLRLLRDAAREINPHFRVVLRPESFDNERPFLWQQFREGLDVEGASILPIESRRQYVHPLYPEIKEVLGSVHHVPLFPEEKTEKERLEERGSTAHFDMSLALGFQFEPLVGVSCPWLVVEKLQSLKQTEAEWVAVVGGTAPPSSAPWWINNEVLRAFQADPKLDVEQLIARVARRWVGAELADDLVAAWRASDEAVRTYPNPNFLYSVFGAVWYRILVRPLVPNIEAVPEAERLYYERHSCNPPHNPQRVDLARDVLFELTTQERCEQSLEPFDTRCLPAAAQAVKMLEKALSKADGAARAVLQDQRDRAVALKCWLRNTRNCAAWVAGVHGYLRATDEEQKTTYRRLVREMMLDEMANTQELLELWETSTTEWMPISRFGESMFLYDENFGKHLRTKLRLMEKHLEDEPYIDPDFMWKNSVGIAS